MHATAAAASQTERQLPGDKAARIVEAMRASVALRGAAGSTFDHVAREAGVSRGLLHYYFGTKERLLVEVVRREDYLCDDATLVILFYDLLTLAQRNEEIAAELAELGRRTRAHLAAVLGAKHDAGTLHLMADPEAVAGVLFSLADGLTVRRLCEPDLDMKRMMVPAVAAARAILG
jgi:AcrR family transcriptional regulator